MIEQTMMMDNITSIEAKIDAIKQSLNSLAYRCGSMDGEICKRFEQIRDTIGCIDSAYNEEV